jgi:hypothetical protein
VVNSNTREESLKVIRGKPATGRPPKIICVGCGKRADEAGIAVPDTDVEEVYGVDGKIGLIIDGDDMQPLCEECVVALEIKPSKQGNEASRKSPNN